MMLGQRAVRWLFVAAVATLVAFAPQRGFA
jgi:hypothetical protein